MITIKNKEITISGGEAPYEYTWTSDSSCVSFSRPNGITTENSFKTNINFEDEACLDTAVITATVVDDNGCTNSTTVSVSNVCDNSGINGISETDNLTFVGSAYSTGCSRISSLVWDYDDAIFEEVNSIYENFTTTLQLKIKDGITNLPSNTVITLTAIDCYGCESEASYTRSICTPSLYNVQTDVYCTEAAQETYLSKRITLPDPHGCVNATPDWSTLSFTIPNSNISVLTNADNPLDLAVNQIRILGAASLTEGLYNIKYSLSTDEGINTNKGSINAKFIACDKTSVISVSHKSVDIGCTLDAGDTLDINIEDEVLIDGDATVDWSTWQIVTPPISLGSATLETIGNGDHVIRYTLPSPVADDQIGWTICDSNGNCAASVVYTLISCKSSPVANDDTATVVCNEPVTIDLLANDVGNGSPLVKSSINITQDPTKGSITLIGDGTAVYTAGFGESGSDTIKYTVDNTNGATSNEATVTITISCAGSDSFFSLCN